MKAFRNGDRLEFTSDVQAELHTPARRNVAGSVGAGTLAVVIHAGKKILLMDGDKALAAKRTLVQVPDWEGLKHAQIHESQAYYALTDAATFLGSRYDAERIVWAILDGGTITDNLLQMMQFARASSICYSEADRINTGFHEGEMSWAAECVEGEEV